MILIDDHDADWERQRSRRRLGTTTIETKMWNDDDGDEDPARGGQAVTTTDRRTRQMQRTRNTAPLICTLAVKNEYLYLD